jgi:hypothetical protein
MQSCLPRRFRLRHSPLSRSHCVMHSCRRESTCEVVSAVATRVLDLICVVVGAAESFAARVAAAVVDGRSLGGRAGASFGGSVGGG